MKIFLSFFVCVFGCLLMEVNASCWGAPPGYKAEKSGMIYEKGTILDTYKCRTFECQDGGIWYSEECPKKTCKKEQIGYQDYIYTIPFPQCCPKPICKEEYE